MRHRHAIPEGPGEWIGFGIVVAMLIVQTQCTELHYREIGQIKRVTVTQIATAPASHPEDPPILYVHYQFMDIARARPHCHIPAQPYLRDESTPLPTGQPVPAIGSIISIEYVPGETGASRLPVQHDDHRLFMFIAMLALFAIGTVWIVRRNKGSAFRPTWDAPGPSSTGHR